MQIKKIFLGLTGIIFALASLFFFYYTARLIYVNLMVAEAASRRSGGMLIGAISFPLAAIIFAIISWFCLKKTVQKEK